MKPHPLDYAAPMPRRPSRWRQDVASLLVLLLIDAAFLGLVWLVALLR